MTMRGRIYQNCKFHDARRRGSCLMVEGRYGESPAFVKQGFCKVNLHKFILIKLIVMVLANTNNYTYALLSIKRVFICQ